MKHRDWIVALFLITVHGSRFTVEAARIEYRQGLPIVYLEGTPYEIGRQHGELLKNQVCEAVGRILGYFRSYPKLFLVGHLAVNWWLDRPWRSAASFIPGDYLEELRGLADGSGVALRELWRLHAIPDRTYACCSLAAWGKATLTGGLVHSRNLDWNIDVGIQRYAAIFVVRPQGKQAFVNVGWAGFVGVLTGINERQLSIGQIGAETADITFRGIPMTFLMRKVLEEADGVEEAVEIVREAPRTVGVNYLIASAKAKRAVAIETTKRLTAVFEANDLKELAAPYARPIPDALFRADTAMYPQIRERQIASGGDPKQPGIEPPTGSAYEVRYLGQAAGILAHYGAIDAMIARQIAQAVAPSSNVQSVVFAWPEVWVANAKGKIPAARTDYHRFDLEELFKEAVTPR